MDAGGTADTALTLPDWSTVEGAASPRDVDVYTIEAPTDAPRCVAVDLDSTLHGVIALGSSEGTSLHGVGEKFNDDAHLGLATMSSNATWLYIKRDDNAPTVHAYSASFSTQQLPQIGLAGGDGGTAAEAGSTPAGALAVTSACTGGVIGPRLGMADPADTYSFAATKGDLVLYSFATPDPSARLAVIDALGERLGSSLAAGEIGAIEVPSTGTFFLEVSSPATSPSAYLFAMTAGPDPGSSCRPVCLV